MGSVLSLWHDSRENALKNPKTASIPDDKALKNAAKYTNIDDLIIDEKIQPSCSNQKYVT